MCVLCVLCRRDQSAAEDAEARGLAERELQMLRAEAEASALVRAAVAAATQAEQQAEARALAAVKAAEQAAAVLAQVARTQTPLDAHS